MANAALTGVLTGNTITLDAPVPELEGCRVLVALEPEEELMLTQKEQREFWEEWSERGPQGPLDDDEEPAFP